MDSSMLPEWGFAGDDEKRRAFIRWVNDELDRFALLTAGRFEDRTDEGAWREVIAAGGARRPVGAPEKPTEGMNEMVWEYALLRYLMNRYWPGRRRRVTDAAHAANIAVARCRAALPRHQRTPDRVTGYRDYSAELCDKLLEEWDRSSPSPGRREADKDIAYLNTLPSNLFER